MNIGIDIDGVLTDFENYVKEKGKIYLNKEIVNPFGDDIREIFATDMAKDDDFWREHIKDYAGNYKSRNDASDFFKQLKEKGFKSYIITNRCRDLSYCDWTASKMQAVIKIWLKDNDINPDNIVYTYGSKLEACVKNNILVMIEDEKKHIKELSNHGIKVIKMLANYNKDCEGKDIYTANNFGDALKIILNLSANN